MSTGIMGIGSTGYVAIEQGRNAVGFELKESYHAMAVKNTNKALSDFNGGGQAKIDKQFSMF